MSGTATNETRDLIASDKVEGTAVYNGTGDRLGTVTAVRLTEKA